MRPAALSRSFGGVLALVLALAALPAPIGSAAPVGMKEKNDPLLPAELTDEHIRKAIGAMVEALYERKSGRSYWDPPRWNESTHGSKFQTGGYTALAVLSLLHAGESYQDPRLRPAVDRLASRKMEGSYAVSLRANVWAKLPPKFREELLLDTQWLLDGFSHRVASWDYHLDPDTNYADNSIRQYGALALWEAAKRGVDIDRRYWQSLEDAFLAGQLDDGAWAYRDGRDQSARGSMTAAGLTVLYITQDFLHAKQAIKLGSSRRSPHEEAIERGLKWMDANFSATDTPGRPDYYYFYYVYGIERVGLASGLKTFGGQDWFRECAAAIIKRLCAWNETDRVMTVRGQGNRADTTMIRQLSFALMFLSRGRVPVAINKLEAPDLAWNNRPRDVANLTRSITEASEMDLNWQIVSIDDEPESWLDAPMLYLASNRSLPWGNGEGDADTRLPPELVKLQRYLDLGGMLLAVNEGSTSSFADSIERLGSRLYPNYEWRGLSDEHWAYTIHARLQGTKPALKALSNGVRELIILSPGGDLAATFQGGADAVSSMSAGGHGGGGRDDPRRNGTGRDAAKFAHFETAANVYFYASELNRPRPRLALHRYSPRSFVRADRTVTIVRAMHDGNWNPEPLALDVFGSYLAAEHGLELRVVNEPLARLADLDPPPLLVIASGTDAHEFDDRERQAILRYANTGGTILFETPGGDGRFTRSAENLATRLFAAPIRSLLRNGLVTGEEMTGGANLSRLDYRPFSFEVFGARETTPRLRGLLIAEEARVLFSREDITHGLLDQPCWGVCGYAPDSARRLLANIVLAAMERSDRP